MTTESRGFQRQVLPWVAVVAALCLLFGGFYARRIGMLSNPYAINDDARSWAISFFRYFDPGTFTPDYLVDYWFARGPIGYQGLMIALSKFFNPGAAGSVIALLMMAPLLVGMAWAARRLGGYVAAFVTLALAISSPLFIDRIASGLPRAYGFPIIAFTVAALAAGRMRWLVAMVIAGGLFHPMAGVLALIALAAVLFLYPEADRGDGAGWSFQKRAVVVLAAGVALTILTVPTLAGLRPFGRGLKPSDVTVYPEIGPTGRFDAPSRIPFPNVARAVGREAFYSISGGGKPWSDTLARHGVIPQRHSTRASIIRILILALIGVGVVWRLKGRPDVRRVFSLLLASVAGYVAASVLSPYFYLPSRYVSYAIPIGVMVLFPVGAAAVAELVARPFTKGKANAWVGTAGMLGIGLLCLLLLGGRGDARQGLFDEKKYAPVFDFVSTLPKDALIAGWPQGVMDDIPYFTHRRVLLSYEFHITFHQTYTDEMRKRMGAVMRAYFAGNPEPILQLRDQYHVTHLLVERSLFSKFPTYFEPFNQDLARLQEAGKESGFEALREIPSAAVYQGGDFAVLDLSRVH